MFSESLISLATQRALGHDTQIECALFEELYEVYINDSNSSTLREHIIARVAGCNPLPGKLGRDAIHIGTNIEKEIKPKNYTGKTTNGSGCFNDYTRARYEKDTAVNLPIIHGLFVHGVLHYVIEFNIDSVSAKLDEQIYNKCEKGQSSLHVVIRSKHRKEGFMAMNYFISELKECVPIWKWAILEDGTKIPSDFVSS